MKICVLNGTQLKGCTWNMKEMFLRSMGEGHEVTEYDLPKDCPEPCLGCKQCVIKSIDLCPHARYSIPIWKSMLESNLIVITSPTYVFHLTGQLKTLLDHFASKWMVHSPEAPMFTKQAVIITNCIGMGSKNVVREIKDSLDFWGVARTYAIRQGLMEADWNKVAPDIKEKIRQACDKVSEKVHSRKIVTPRLRIRIIFTGARFSQKMIDRQQHTKGNPQTKDYLYWKENGWLDGSRPF